VIHRQQQQQQQNNSESKRQRDDKTTSSLSGHQEAHMRIISHSKNCCNNHYCLLPSNHNLLIVAIVVLVTHCFQNNPPPVGGGVQAWKPIQYSSGYSIQQQQQQQHRDMKATKTTSKKAKPEESSSTVLGELKDTIRKQQEEISNLKKQLVVVQQQQQSSSSSLSNKTSGSSVGHHGGGGHGVTAATMDIDDYLQQPFYDIAMKRVGWLGLFLISLSLTALIMNNFEHTLEGQIELAYFVPLLAGHGGNTGGQTVGTVLSALSSGRVQPHRDAVRIIAKEACSGILSGIVLALAVAPTAHYVMGISKHVTTVLFLTMPLVSTIAATLGSSIPFLCVLLGLDPSVIAAPAMTSFVDVSGLMSYFLIANFIFKLFGLQL
jgi:cation transporter-like permease